MYVCICVHIFACVCVCVSVCVCVCVCAQSCLTFCYSRQEYWNRLPFPTSGFFCISRQILYQCITWESHIYLYAHACTHTNTHTHTHTLYIYRASQMAQWVRYCLQCKRYRRHEFDSWVRMIPYMCVRMYREREREWVLPFSIYLPIHVYIYIKIGERELA